jgi:hypothetical protein
MHLYSAAGVSQESHSPFTKYKRPDTLPRPCQFRARAGPRKDVRQSTTGSFSNHEDAGYSHVGTRTTLYACLILLCGRFQMRISDNIITKLEATAP